MHNSALINLNILEACLRRNSKRIFYSSSACIYPEHQQRDPHKISLPEDCAPVPFPPHTSPEMHSLDHR
jgi:nucleoside-diphosphate-sugar epimerase